MSAVISVLHSQLWCVTAQLTFPSTPTMSWVFGTLRSETLWRYATTLMLNGFKWPHRRGCTSTHATDMTEYAHAWYLYHMTPMVINSNSSLIIQLLQHVFVLTCPSPSIHTNITNNLCVNVGWAHENCSQWRAKVFRFLTGKAYTCSRWRSWPSTL